MCVAPRPLLAFQPLTPVTLLPVFQGKKWKEGRLSVLKVEHINLYKVPKLL